MSKTRDQIYDVPNGLPRLLEVMRRLRDPETGCPWDVEQDFGTIAPYTIEEAYEVADAITRESWNELESELGDLLLQVVYHAQMGSEAGHFDFDSVARRTSEKMIDRHPHVFGKEQMNKTAAQQTRDWESAKAKERAASGAAGVLDDVA
ncbi:MAG: MazG nucleotide pyrophosphohydrolase domain-containing protein, partial [Boseongicola sp.]